MARPEKMTSMQISEALTELPDWKLVDGRDAIQRLFKFKDFTKAFAFMSAIAPIADELDHHPEWSNVYNKVDVTLTTHDVDGITSLDIALAKAMDKHFPS